MDEIPTNNISLPPTPEEIKWYQKGWGMTFILFSSLILIFLVAIIIIILIFFGDTNNNQTNQNVGIIFEENTLERQRAEKSDRPYFGNLDAKLVIVEFSDFQCPVCQREFPIIREITAKYKNDILYIYRNYPVIDSNSNLVAQASLCAYEQDKFWSMHDKLFLSSQDISSSDVLRSLARQSGVDLNQFNECLNNQKYNIQVAEDFSDAIALGAVGTPTFFINGHKLAGAVTKEQWEDIIQKALRGLE